MEKDPVFPGIKSQTIDWEQIFFKHPGLVLESMKNSQNSKLKQLEKYIWKMGTSRGQTFHQTEHTDDPLRTGGMLNLVSHVGNKLKPNEILLHTYYYG